MAFLTEPAFSLLVRVPIADPDSILSSPLPSHVTPFIIHARGVVSLVVIPGGGVFSSLEMSGSVVVLRK